MDSCNTLQPANAIITAVPTSTPYPTHTPYPTATSYPTSTRYPTATLEPSPTPIPSITPTPTQAVLIYEDFEGETTCFPLGEIKSDIGQYLGRAEIRDGVYHLWLNTKANKWLPIPCDVPVPERFTLEAEIIRQSDGNDSTKTFGISLLSRGKEGWYSYLISLKPSSYCFQYNSFSAEKALPLIGCWPRKIILSDSGWGVSEMSGLDHYYLKMKVQEGLFEIFLFDQTLGAQQDYTQLVDQVGLAAGGLEQGGQLHVAFDNFKVTVP